MKNAFVILITVLIFTSCSSPNKAITERLLGSDSVAINFFKGDGTMDTVVSVHIFRDLESVNKLASLVGEKASKKSPDCGYDGSMHFFKMSKVIQDIEFRMNDEDCMYFFFLQDGERKATELSSEAKALISQVSKKQ